ncbi:MAG: hypothetical protein Q8935_03380 [Bacillota bacterium]|jgi:CCR4-NOT transcriptional regulation complex NOT5 subunit|nr:hypothetical protein [Bacillota bacterium]
MFNFFSFKQNQNKKDKLNSQIVTRLDRIIELLEEKQNEDPLKNIQFEHVHIDNLENIIFRLDHIEIEDLSGKLVIGNNISTTDDLKESLFLKVDKENAKKDAMSESSLSTHVHMEKTSKGFRFRNDI